MASNTIVGQGDEEGLRKVEKDVLITKKVKYKAMDLCSDIIKEFEDCVRGRTVTAAWKCRGENKRMQECLTNYYKDTAFYEQCKKEYLEERERFRTSGERAPKMKRTS